MVRAVLLGQQEFVETMADVTPELLRLQEELVKTLRAGFESAQDQFRQGTEMDFTDIAQTYYKELEALQIMKARLNKKSISGKEILKIQIAVRSDALASLKQYSTFLQEMFQAGTASSRKVGEAKAKVLKAEIMLMVLKHATRE